MRADIAESNPSDSRHKPNGVSMAAPEPLEDTNNLKPLRITKVFVALLQALIKADGAPKTGTELIFMLDIKDERNEKVDLTSHHSGVYNWLTQLHQRKVISREINRSDNPRRKNLKKISYRYALTKEGRMYALRVLGDVDRGMVKRVAEANRRRLNITSDNIQHTLRVAEIARELVGIWIAGGIVDPDRKGTKMAAYDSLSKSVALELVDAVKTLNKSSRDQARDR